MSLFKIALKAGASVALLAAMASPALAVRVQGGGSSLLAPYFAQVYCVRTGGFNPPLATPPANCHISAADGDHGRLFSSTAQVNIQDPSVNDPTPNTVDLFDYLISNSGGGQKAILTATSSQLGTFPPGTHTALPYPTRNTLLGFSDAPLSAAAITAYASGGSIGDLSIALAAPGVSPTGSEFGNPQSDTAHGGASFGKLIQFPVTIDPVAIGYNTSSITVPGGGPVKLDQATYCDIFNHVITDWNNSAISALNGGSVTGGVSLPIRLVGRTNGSGTNSIFTHNLNVVCNGRMGNQFTTTNLSAGAFKNIPATLTGFYNLDADSPTEVADINGTAGSIGYVGADYATPSTAVAITVQSALLKENAPLSTTYWDPSSTNAVNAFGSIVPPSGSARQDAANWVPDTSAPAAGYPIIGTTNIVTYTTTGSAAKATALVDDGTGSNPEGLLHWYYNSSNSAPAAIMSQANLGVLPSSWNTAITDSFITGSDGQGNGIH